MPTVVATALGVLLNDPHARTLPCGVFGSFGWSGEAVDEMDRRLTGAGFKVRAGGPFFCPLFSACGG